MFQTPVHLAFLTASVVALGSVTAMANDAQIKRGEYLVMIGGCNGAGKLQAVRIDGEQMASLDLKVALSGIPKVPSFPVSSCYYGDEEMA